MNRRGFLKSMAIVGLLAVFPELLRPKSKSWWVATDPNVSAGTLTEAEWIEFLQHIWNMKPTRFYWDEKGNMILQPKGDGHAGRVQG